MFENDIHDNCYQHLKQNLFSSFPKMPAMHVITSIAFIWFCDYVPFRLDSKLLCVGLSDKLLLKLQSPWH